MKEANFCKELRPLGGNGMTTKGFSVPHEIREGMNLEEGDMLQIKIEKAGEENE